MNHDIALGRTSRHARPFGARPDEVASPGPRTGAGTGHPRAAARPARWPALWAICLAATLAAAADRAVAADTTPALQLQRFAQQAGGAGDAERGRTFFTSRHGGEWSCASCHGQPPLADGKHAGTGKRIDPLAPAANPRAFTDTARVDKWLRRNCNDVLKRECTAAEKADVLAWLVGLRP